jgi:hypothetical protein
LRGGPRGFRPGFSCPAVLRNSSRKATCFRLRDCYPLWFDVPVDSTNTRLCNFPTRRQTDQDEPYNPCTTTTAVYHIAQVWAESLFARHYSGSRGFFPFLRVLRCFSSPACLFLPYVFRQEYARITTRRFPHSEIPGSTDGQLLPGAYRSRPRPSSALGAKASTVCSFSLDSKEHVFTAAMEFSRCARASTELTRRHVSTDGLSKLNSVNVELDVVLGEPKVSDGRSHRRVSTPSRSVSSGFSLERR